MWYERGMYPAIEEMMPSKLELFAYGMRVVWMRGGDRPMNEGGGEFNDECKEGWVCICGF